MAWVNIDIFDTQIAFETDKAILVKIPQSKTKFWLPRRVVHSGKTYNSVSIGINEDWDYMTERGKTRIKESIKGIDLAELFSNQVPIRGKKYKPAQYIKHVPSDQEPIKNRVIDDDLIR